VNLFGLLQLELQIHGNMQHARLFFPFKNALGYCFSIFYRRFLLQPPPTHSCES